MRCTTHPVGSAGPLPCNKIQSDTQSTCITDVGASFTGHSGTLELWSDRHYAWITAPGDALCTSHLGSPRNTTAAVLRLPAGV